MNSPFSVVILAAVAVKEHKERAKKSVSCYVLTVSDTRDEKTDESGRLISSLLAQNGHKVAEYSIVRDEPREIQDILEQALMMSGVDAVILNGGTGIAPRDGTYEVVERSLEKRLDGFGEIFRYLSFQDIGSSAILSRAVAGMAKGKIVVSLPGSKGAVELAMRRLILPELGHMVSQVQGT